MECKEVCILFMDLHQEIYLQSFHYGVKLECLKF
jgi:hypothetical protein